MQVKEPRAIYAVGRQLTELGELPVDWLVAPLGSFDPFVTSGSRGWASYYAEAGSAFLRITNLSRSRIYPSSEDLRYVAVPPGNGEGIRTALRADDVLISITADVGIIGFVTDEIEFPAYINQHIALVRFDDSRVDARYVAYYLAGAASQARFKALTDAGAKAGMSLAVVKQILAAMPPTRKEQANIAQALADVDALIDSLEQLLAKKRQIKEGAMQDLLTSKRRLPGQDKAWQLKSMSALFDFFGGHSASRDQLGDSGICYLHYGDIHMSSKTHVDLDAQHHLLPKLGVTLREVSETALLRDGDVVFVDASEDEDGVSKHVVVQNTAARPFIAGLHTIVARPKTADLSDRYKRYCFQVNAVRKQFRFYAVGTKVSGVSKRNIGKIVLTVPSREEQEHVAEVLLAMDADIAATESRLAKARDLKQGVMQVLLTGRIRLR